MILSVNQNLASTYDDFKALVAALCPNGANVFYSGSTNLKSICAVAIGCCKGEAPLAINIGGADLSTFSIAVTTVTTDFPNAVHVTTVPTFS